MIFDIALLVFNKENWTYSTSEKYEGMFTSSYKSM